jgi:hypothetical protein
MMPQTPWLSPFAIHIGYFNHCDCAISPIHDSRTCPEKYKKLFNAKTQRTNKTEQGLLKDIYETVSLNIV